jgi:hypothetical protein
MGFGDSQRRRGARVVVMLVIASLLTAFGTAAGSAAVRAPQAAGTGKWQLAMQQLRVPGRGCFTAAYPRVAWLKAPCKAAPRHPYPPAHGHRPQTVGNSNDYSAQVAGQISSATGSFDTVSTGATETGQQNGAGGQVANTFSLQLNVAPFTTPACAGSGNPGGCLGWEQFLYSTTANQVFIQYWLLQYNATCPSGWTKFMFQGSTDIYCFINSSGSTLTGGALTVAGLASTNLTGSAVTGGNDTVVMTTGTGHATASGADDRLTLSKSWNTVEFAIVGDCCGTQANFSAGTTVKVRTTVHSGSKTAPTCVLEGFTGETNNLNLAGTPAIGTQASPTIVSEQTSSPGTASCAAASGIGDTHLTTFRDLLYDFQASGDFTLATTGPGFVVQTRQVSGAPAWPNAAVNQDVATHVGKTNVAVCTAPTRLVVNNKRVNLINGKQLNLPDGGDVSLHGNVYLIRGANGNSVRATVNPGTPNWIDVSVGLNRWPIAERGLLANAGTNVNAIEARDGTVLTAPFAFNQFYGLYGNSWRVPASQSLLSACGDKVIRGNPTTLFYTNNLPPVLAKQARGVCIEAKIRVPALLDACTVDVAMLGNKAAVKAYLSEPANVTVGEITLPPFSRPAR